MAERIGPDRWFFDVWSRFYDAPLVQRLTYRPEHDAVLRGLRRRAPRCVLDVACGTGQLAARVRTEHPDARVVGCDFSAGMLQQARTNGRVLLLVRGAALGLPFADESFDAVVSTEAFHWFPDQLQAMQEFHRVLLPGGRLLVSLVNPPLEAMSRAARRLSRLAGEPANWPTRERMRALVEGAGLRVTTQRLVARIPGMLLAPSVLTVAERPAVQEPALGN